MYMYIMPNRLLKVFCPTFIGKVQTATQNPTNPPEIGVDLLETDVHWDVYMTNSLRAKPGPPGVVAYWNWTRLDPAA